LFKKVLIANRGAIACRIERTLKKLGVESVAVYSDADFESLHVSMADHTVRIGEGPVADSYLNVDRILDAARQTGAEAIHPGYGFLSENAAFAEACETAGIAFLGPTPEQIRAFGLKNTARDLATAASVPILPGTKLLENLLEAQEQAASIGYPVMLKSAGGGGGIGMQRCMSEADLSEAYERVKRLSETHFKGSGIFLEKLVSSARHIEVQVFGDGLGNVIALGERDCSVQRRNQKIVEETPAPGLSDEVRGRLQQVSIALMESVHYRSAGTVEFLYDTDSQQFYFLEVNSRLQVEHGVTEEVWGVDIVEWMVRLAAGEMPSFKALNLKADGAAIQVRLYAENPLEQFQPSSGRITEFITPANVRCDTWIENGVTVSPFYDPLLAKVIVKAEDRPRAVAAMQHALDQCQVYGFETNLEFLKAVLSSETFVSGQVTTGFLSHFQFSANKVKVLDAGVMTTLQGYPGRLGYWSVGVPPSGPMDDLCFRLANRILENHSSATALECTLAGPTLKFFESTSIAICGANMQPRLNGNAVPLWRVITIQAGDVLATGAVSGPGARMYIAVADGFAAPSYLGSQTTFTLGKFGGHDGRSLRTGDYLSLDRVAGRRESGAMFTPPTLSNQWEIAVTYGPHGAPDFFTDEDIRTFFDTHWKVHHNSSRTGVRLIGPKPYWARSDGGDAGLHPSNLHDNAYAVGAIDFTGDMPVILGPDGPSLGGFVCPAVVVSAELWKLGQLSPGDVVRFLPVSYDSARDLQSSVSSYVDTLEGPAPAIGAETREPAIVASNPKTQTVTRTSGDRYLLIEFGEAALDLNLRFRAHALMQALEHEHLDGIVDLTPGIRSLQIHYEPAKLTRDKMLTIVADLTTRLPEIDDLKIPSRIVHLPLSWDDPATRLAIERYIAAVRPDAPWCPSNLEFIRRINGLDSISDVHRIVFDANYLVLGLGDVYLGAPVATPTDPRHRLVTTKYNPARTWTPENAVGIGGAYLCVYGMEGPGGYQFVGRTVQMWNTYRATHNFETGKPWLLRFFDQIRFYPVAAEELLDLRRRFPLGRFELQAEPSIFDLAEYHRFLRAIARETKEFRTTQQNAFAAERERWAQSGEFEIVGEPPSHQPSEHHIPAGCAVLRAPTTASVWQVKTSVGNRISEGEQVIVLEAMKMEIAVHASEGGEIVELLCQPGSFVTAGQPLILYRA
jgi:urea carboxylase